jgi:hypothetical protein
MRRASSNVSKRDAGLFACLSRIDIDERLTVRVENFEAARYLLDLPGRRETGVMSWEPILRRHEAADDPAYRWVG